jgi:drug/metabolite transporter (DMT)-like permease
MVSPIFTIIAAIYLLGEPFGLIDMLGTALTLIGIGLYTYFDKRTTN